MTARTTLDGRHTPGPWQFVPAQMTNRRKKYFRPACVRLPDGSIVAECGFEADLRLIAAAPELLAVLQAAYTQAEESDRGTITVGMRERMEAAIAKAEGRAP